MGGMGVGGGGNQVDSGTVGRLVQCLGLGGVASMEHVRQSCHRIERLLERQSSHKKVSRGEKLAVALRAKRKVEATRKDLGLAFVRQVCQIETWKQMELQGSGDPGEIMEANRNGGFKLGDLKGIVQEETAVQEAEDELRESHARDMQVLQEGKRQALGLADGFAQRDTAVKNLLRFSLDLALRNRRALERAQREVALCNEQERLLSSRHEADLHALARARQVLATSREETEAVGEARAAAEDMRESAFQRLENRVQVHVDRLGREVSDQDLLIQTVRHEAELLRNCRRELGSCVEEIARSAEDLKTQAMECEARQVLVSWMQDAGQDERLGRAKTALDAAVRDRAQCVRDLQSLIRLVDNQSLSVPH